jgi:copper chaperone NosL
VLKTLFAAGIVAVSIGCAAAPPAPAALDPANDACRHCRMAVSDRRFAAQIVARGEEPLFFDDLGCLRDYVAAHPDLPRGAAVFVADHRTREWIDGSRAVFARQPALATPMASGLVAHADAASRDRDPEAAGARAVPAAEVLGPLAGQSGGDR